MATKTISSFGTTESFVKNVLMASGATEADKNGRLYLDGSMVNAELSNTIAEALYIGEIFRDGQSVTGKYTTDRKSGAVRVMLDTPYPQTSRTTSYGGRPGTPGNAGVINVNQPLLPANEEFMVYLNQVNDQVLYFPDLGKEYLPLDIMSKKISGYASSVVQDRTASTLAEIISYAAFRSLSGADNLNTFTKGTTKYGDLLADLNSKLDNGDILGSAFTFSNEGRTIIGRPAFINGMFGSDSGVVVIGSNLAQEMLRDYDLSPNVGDKSYVGQGYRGRYGQFHFQSAPDYIWTLAEKYLGLASGALANVQAIAVSFEATAMGRITDLGVKMVDSSGKRGVEAQPLNIWGHEAFRLSQLIGDNTLTNDNLIAKGFSEEERKYPCAPSQITTNDKLSVPIYAADGVTIVGFREIAQINKPNGGNIQSGVKAVQTPVLTKGGNFTTSKSVTITSATAEAKVYYTNDGTTPTNASTEYTVPITLTATTTIKAVAIKSGMLDSEVATTTYTKTN